MPLRVAFLAAECEPWAKTGGLADVVDALARALGTVAAGDLETPVDVFLPRYRGVAIPSQRVSDGGAARPAVLLTVHILPYHGWRRPDQVAGLGWEWDAAAPPEPPGVDLLH